MTTDTSPVVTFGEILTRFHAPGHRRLRQSLPGTLDVSFAGSEANVAASLAMFGVEARFVTVLPQNPIAEACQGFLRSVGVNTDSIIVVPESRMGTCYIERGANQRPSAVE